MHASEQRAYTCDTVRKNHTREKTPVMKIEVTLFDQAEENPTGDVVEVVQTESGFLSAETVRGIVQSRAERLVVQEVGIALLEQPWCFGRQPWQLRRTSWGWC